MIFLAPLIAGICSMASGAAATATAAVAATAATVGSAAAATAGTVGALTAGKIGALAVGSVAAGALMSSGSGRRADDIESRLASAETKVRELQSRIVALEADGDEGDGDCEDLVRLAELQQEIDAIASRIGRC